MGVTRPRCACTVRLRHIPGFTAAAAAAATAETAGRIQSSSNTAMTVTPPPAACCRSADGVYTGLLTCRAYINIRCLINSSICDICDARDAFRFHLTTQFRPPACDCVNTAARETQIRKSVSLIAGIIAVFTISAESFMPNIVVTCSLYLK